MAMTKADARQTAKTVRKAAHTADEGDAADRLATRFLSTPDLVASVGPGSAVSGYWPIGSEIDPRPLMAALHGRGAVVGLPVIDPRARCLSFRTWRPGLALQAHGFGTAVPPADSPPLDPDLVLVPLLAFDRFGTRLGYGQGHYDRTLADLRARRAILVVGLAYAAQEMDLVPAEGHDAPLDWIVTERHALACRPRFQNGA